MTAIIVACITGPVTAFVVGWLNRQDMKRRVGTPNGNGNLMQMQEAMFQLLVEHQKQDAENFDELRGAIARLSRSRSSI